MVRAAGISSTVSCVSALTAGLMNRVFRITTTSGREYVLRVRTFQHAEYGQEFAAERFAYPLIESLGVEVPKLIFADADSNKYGYPYAIFEFVEGRTLDDMFSDSSVTQQTKCKLFEQLGRVLGRLHSVRGPGYGTLRRVDHSRDQVLLFWGNLFTNEADRLSLIDSTFAQDFRKAVERWLETLASMEPTLQNPCLVHGDVHGKNILVTPTGKLILIDWEASRFRCAPCDFAQVRYLNLRAIPSLFQALLSAYLSERNCETGLITFVSAIEVFEVFWHVRMGLFQLQFPKACNLYFGTHNEHLDLARNQISKFV
jgi:aminoglycoside phosphotransferase (APT) family kinase protein